MENKFNYDKSEVMLLGPFFENLTEIQPYQREVHSVVTVHVEFSTPGIFSMYFDEHKLDSKWTVLSVEL